MNTLIYSRKLTSAIAGSDARRKHGIVTSQHNSSEEIRNVTIPPYCGGYDIPPPSATPPNGVTDEVPPPHHYATNLVEIEKDEGLGGSSCSLDSAESYNVTSRYKYIYIGKFVSVLCNEVNNTHAGISLRVFSIPDELTSQIKVRSP